MSTEIQATEEKNSGAAVSAVQAIAPTLIGTQENLIFCAHRGHGCISQNGYLCLHGPKCEPIDDRGRRFAVFHWIENGQPLATRRYLDQGELAPRKPVADVYCADTMQAQAEARIRGCGA